MILKKCLVCNEEFNDNTINNIKKYCSVKCRKKNNKLNYRLKNKEKISLSNKRYRLENKLKCDLLRKNWKSLNFDKIKLSQKKSNFNYKTNPLNKIKILCHKKIYSEKNNLKLLDYCEICNSNINLLYHHEDYFKPLNVLCLCRKCHILRHKKIITIESNISVTKCKDLYIKKFLHI